MITRSLIPYWEEPVSLFRNEQTLICCRCRKLPGNHTFCKIIVFKKKLFQKHFTKQNPSYDLCECSLCAWHVCATSFFSEESIFMPVTVLSGWLQPLLVLLGIHSLEPEMCLQHVTNYLRRLTLRDLAGAFTLLRCCLGETYFRGLLSQFKCLTGVLRSRCGLGQKLLLCSLCVCLHILYVHM